MEVKTGLNCSIGKNSMQWLSKMSKLKGSFFLHALTVPSLPVKAPSVGLLYPFDKTAVVFVFRQDVLQPPGTHLAFDLESPFFHGTLIPLRWEWYLEITTWMVGYSLLLICYYFQTISSYEICLASGREKQIIILYF